MIRVRDITLAFDHDEDALSQSIQARLGVGEAELVGFRVIRRSIDARRKSRIFAVYTVDAEVVGEPAVLERLAGDAKVSASPDMEYHMPVCGDGGGDRPVIVGSGPCGLFAGLILAQAGLKPLIIERGKEVQKRVQDVQRFWHEGLLDTESNAQFGEGGAGTFSDGKLTTQIKDKFNRCRKVLEEFVKAGAPQEILYQANPHIGTDNLVRIVKAIRNTIISLGGQVRFETKLTGIKVRDGKVTGAVVNDGQEIGTDSIILATGHSAHDTFEMLVRSGVPIEAKAFSIGVRIEHPQAMVDKAQYGRFASNDRLGPADYKLVEHCANERSAYTFCMCPGGEVIGCSSQAGTVVINGMSFYSRGHANANSALLVGVGPDDFGGEGPLAGVEFQQQWERKAFVTGGGNYCAPVQLVGDFLAGRISRSLGQVEPTYQPGVALCDLAECLPGFVAQTLALAIPAMDRKLRGFAMHNAVMTAVESRSSSPIRILRDESFQSLAVRGLYPAGEGAGYAGGIISSAVDGIKAAEALIGK